MVFRVTTQQAVQFKSRWGHWLHLLRLLPMAVFSDEFAQSKEEVGEACWITHRVFFFSVKKFRVAYKIRVRLSSNL